MSNMSNVRDSMIICHHTVVLDHEPLISVIKEGNPRILLYMSTIRQVKGLGSLRKVGHVSSKGVGDVIVG